MVQHNNGQILQTVRPDWYLQKEFSDLVLSGLVMVVTPIPIETIQHKKTIWNEFWRISIKKAISSRFIFIAELLTSMQN